jgi:hypothetical protein
VEAADGGQKELSGSRHPLDSRKEVWTSAVTTNSIAERLGNIVFACQTVCQRHGGLENQNVLDEGYYPPKGTLATLRSC